MHGVGNIEQSFVFNAVAAAAATLFIAVGSRLVTASFKALIALLLISDAALG